MKIADKTKEQLVEDLEALRSRIAELERTEAKCKQREEAIRKLEEEKLSILNSMSERVVYQNQQHRILWANKAAAEAADLAREQLVGCYCYEIWQKRSEPCDDCPVAKARETGKPQASEMTTPEGKVLFIQGYPIRDTDDRIVGLVEVALEITERKQVEEALRKGERKYELLFESTLDGMFVLDAETMKIVLANQAAVDIYGLNSVEDAIGVNLLDFVPPEERERVLRIIVKDMFENDLRQVNEFRGITRDGREIWVSAVGTRTEYRGKLAGLISFSDITERKQAEEALQKSREELRKMFESVTDGISVVDLNGIITDVNQRTVEMHGFSSKDEILGKNALELVAPRDHKRAAINMRQTLKEGLSREVEYTLLKADGSEFPGELSTSVLKDAAGNLVGHITIVRDITERKEAEETLQAERNKLQSVIDALEDGLTIQDRDYNILYQSKPSQTTAGYHPGEKCYRVYEGRDKVCDGCPAEKAFRDGKSHTSERRIVTLSGEVLFLENTASPIRDAEGKIVSCLEITRDVTERKRAEQVLRESETKHRTIFENVSDVVVRLNKRGKIIDANKRIEDYFGYKPDEIIGKNFAKLGVLSPKDLPKAVKLFSAGIKGKSSPLIELEVKRKDGSTAHLEANTTLIKENGKIEGTIAIIRDITERKQVEEALREAEEEKSALLEEAPIAIINTDLKGKITYVNKRFESESGYSRGEIVGKNGLQLDWLPAGTIRYLTKRMVARLRGRPGKHWATQFKCKDGRWIWVEIEGKVLRKLGVPAGFQIIARNITERKQVEEALRIEKNKLQSVIDALEYGLTIQDRDYNILYKNELLKTESGDRLGEKCYRAYEGRDKPCDDCPVEKAFKDGKSHTSERKIVSPSGEALCLENTANPIRDAKGKIVSCLEITRDITERKEMEEALQKNRGELRTMFESVTDGISVVDLNGIITEVNQRAVEMHGFSSKKEMVGKNAFELVAPCDHKRVAANMRKALTQGVIKGVEYTLLKADGSEFPGELSTNMLKDATGKAVGHITIARDITERKEAEELYSTLANSSPVGVYIAQDGKFQFVNPQFQKYTGFSEDELLDKESLELVHPEDRERVRENAVDMLKGKRLPPYELRYVVKGGKILWATETVTSIQYRGKRAVLGNFMDITERKQTEEALHRAKEQFQALVDESPLGVSMLTKDGRYQYVNPKFVEMFGYTLEDIPTGQEWFAKAYPDPEYRRKVIANWHADVKSLKRGEVEAQIYTVTCKDGSEKITQFRPVALETGDYLVIYEDITERKRAEEALERQRAYFQQLFDNSPEAIVLLNEDNRIVNTNKGFETLFGYTMEEVKGQPLSEVIVPENHVEEAHTLSQAFLNNETSRKETVRKRKDGSRVDVALLAYPIWSGDKVVGAYVIYRDITERKRAEEQLRESEERYRNLFEGTHDMIQSVAPDGHFIFANRAWLETMGYTEAELPGLNLFQIIHPESLSHCQEMFSKVMAGESVDDAQATFVAKDGRSVLVEGNAVGRYVNGELVATHGIFRDITERKRAEEELKLRAQILDSATDSIFVHDNDDNFIYVNEAACRAHGYSREEFAKMKIPQLVDPERARPLDSDRQELLKKGHIVVESAHVRKDGSIMPVEVHARTVGSGKEKLFLTVARDITERKRAEEEKKEMEQKAHLASRLASVGEMASGIAHEINNPLTSVIGFSQLLMEGDIPADIKEDVSIIYKEAQRAAGVAKNLLTFARKQAPAKQSTNVNRIIDGVLKLRAYEQKVSNIQVDSQLAPDLPEVMADYSQLQQVFINIIINAESAMIEANGGGTLTITTQRVNNTVRASFSDDGPGITKENLNRIFDPFFTTKEVGKGTGLGLSVCHGIVTEHSGKIYARSKLGKGTTFVVELPVNNS